MRKHMKHEKSSHGSDKAGWFMGMLHVIDYHHWKTKHWRKHRPICWGTPRTHSLVREGDEKQPFLNPTTNDSKLIAIAKSPKKETKLKKKKITKSFSQKHVKEYMDIMEILEKNEILVKILKNSPDSDFKKQFQIKQTRRNLTKSGSFPLSRSSRALNLRPTTIEHKQREHWFGLKRDSSVLTLYVPKFDVNGNSKEQTRSSISSSDDDHGFSHAVMNGFREVKKWLKNVFKDKKNKKKKKKKGSIEMDDDLQRTSSLNDSLHRYSQLIDQNFKREVGLHSKSLKLSNEENKNDSRNDKPKFFRRISSLSSLESLGSFLTEVSLDSLESQKNTVSESAEDISMASDFPESVPLPKIEEEEEDHEDHREIISERPISETEQQDPDSVPSSSFSDNTVRKAETLLAQGPYPKISDIQSDTHNSSLQSNPKEQFKLEIYNQEEEEEEAVDTYLSYLKNVLEVSGLNLEGEWHSKDQPLNPSLLFKLKPYLQEEEDELGNQLLFDLINEAIIEMYNQSQTYFPRAFSFVDRMKKEEHFLDNVWKRMQWSLSAMEANKKDCSLDDLVARDLGKSDGWMNVQVEVQFLVLLLEDLIFYDILDDLFCVCP